MEANNTQKSPNLPPEIISLIVHEIASQNSALEALKACSLVSKSFCFFCRRHLFSDIELLSDSWQSQAARLVKILQNPDNVGLAACVRSLTLIFDVQSNRTYSFLGSRTLGYGLNKSKMTALTLAARLRLYEDNLIKVLNLLMQAHLESFTLHARKGVSDWETEAGAARSMKKAVFMACTAPLTTLRLSNLVNIDEYLIARVIHSSTLKELALTNVTLKVYDEDANFDPQPMTSQIERLDLRRVSYMQIFRVMGHPTLAALPMPYPFISLPRLRNLIISSPWTDLEADPLREFMLGVAKTLEILEIEEINWRGT